MAIKAICFDLDGVYFTPRSFQNFKQKIKGENSDDKVNNTLYKSDEILAFKAGKISENAFWAFVKKELGINITSQEIFNMLRESYEINKDIAQVVKKTREKGYKTAICSNNFETRIRELQLKFQFLDDFDTKVFSYEVGFLKPDKRIFQELVKRSGVKPEEILYSDDCEEKLTGAKEIGIQTFVFRDFDQFMAELKTQGVNI